MATELAEAHEYERNGQYEAAIAAYQGVIQQADGQARQEARYDLALTYIAIERYSDAIIELEAYIDDKPSPEESLRASFLLGGTYAAIGDVDNARQALEEYAEDGGPAAVYARLELAQLLVQQGRHDKAAQELEKALALDVPSSLAPTVFLRLADAYREADDDEKAMQWYDRLLQESTSDTYRAVALSRIASLSRSLADGERWQQALLDIVEQYPGSPQAPNALDSLLAADVPLGLLTQGIVHYRQWAYDEALAVFDSLLAADPPPQEAAAAHYYRGTIRQRRQELQEALADYEASLQLDPDGELAEDAAWARAVLIHELAEPFEAAEAYRESWQGHPDSDRAGRAAFLSGLIPHQTGDAPAAVAAWEEMLDAFTSPEGRAQAHLWLGQADMIFFGDSEGASAHFHQALEAAPASFYALRAEAWLGDEAAVAPPVGAGERIATASPDWNAAEAWLSSLWGPQTLAVSPSPLDTPAWQRGQELYRLGLTRQATDEFLWLIDQGSSQPWSLYRLARALHDLGLTHVAIRAASDLLESANDPLEQAPRALLELAYPLDYRSLIDEAAAESGLSPLLLLALIRQESSFDPKAGSPAGALGLTQIVPLTASEIAQNLDIEHFSAPDLLLPVVSIRFGAHYLRSQLDLFDDNLFVALAAYNGGPGNAIRWQENLPAADMDPFVELIDFDETRSYVKLVLENYAVYRFVYGAADHPTLLSSPDS